jgi:hypothetical protein
VAVVAVAVSTVVPSTATTAVAPPLQRSERARSVSVVVLAVVVTEPVSVSFDHHETALPPLAVESVKT